MQNIGRFVAVLLLASSPALPQTSAIKEQLARTRSIGDAVRRADASARLPAPKPLGPKAKPVNSSQTIPPIHVLYMHGMNDEGANDSQLLRKGICTYLRECTVSNPPVRIYADGPFAVDTAPPGLDYMQSRIWTTPEGWSASAPFIDRYQITGNGHTPIVLDELNWWPLAYPLKCKALIAHDATLTGPASEQMKLCAVPGCKDPNGCNTPDTDHPKRFLSYQWIPPAEAAALFQTPRHAAFVNRALKNGLMDWGFGDAVMALGPMEQILQAGIRELLVKSLQSAGVDLETARTEDPGPDFFFITHSLGSYLALAALDSDWLGPQTAELPRFKITPEERKAADYFSAHTSGFYFLANQIQLLELARVSVPDQAAITGCPLPSGKPLPAPLAHWQCRRRSYLNQGTGETRAPQIIAWSDPSDLLSWKVPDPGDGSVVNIPVRNPGLRIPPLVAWPTSVHSNYAENSNVLRVIFKPSVTP